MAEDNDEVPFDENDLDPDTLEINRLCSISTERRYKFDRIVKKKHKVKPINDASSTTQSKLIQMFPDHAKYIDLEMFRVLESRYLSGVMKKLAKTKGKEVPHTFYSVWNIKLKINPKEVIKQLRDLLIDPPSNFASATRRMECIEESPNMPKLRLLRLAQPHRLRLLAEYEDHPHFDLFIEHCLMEKQINKLNWSKSSFKQIREDFKIFSRAEFSRD
ncbi:unnamed protein product [Caenorhabditis angaria]|uniref:Uncharacterized protein n=1 Tax=Caenorhabditis angaria TaxID=860376 RepID=A0A9P1N445_9PELO|nr:unnamed protein product [Caenorhabditis angaria]